MSPALVRLRKEDCYKFMASLGYRVQDHSELQSEIVFQKDQKTKKTKQNQQKYHHHHKKTYGK